ncbi:hypothetical protein EYF80_002672 [Liparis tanakae]|uniref:Uncharacterized protein n=1 Tax=Liparis tanakae TaxID=230148 RepID=A0A4Z2JA47_9TELE|nr:hypothetical protein EYF80_002672 [Liparis tanakae]
MGELESSIWMGGVRQQGALSLQQVRHALQELPEPKRQGSLPKTVQLLADPNIKTTSTKSSQREEKAISEVNSKR